MKRIIFSLLVALGLIFEYGVAFASESCVFDNNYYSKETYKSDKRIKSFVWDKDNQIAKILTAKGSIISAQHWDCRHLGVKAISLLDEVDMGRMPVVKEKLLEMINLFIRKPDREAVRRQIDDMECLHEKQCKKNIAISGYSEIYLATVRQQNSMTVLLKFYIN